MQKYTNNVFRISRKWAVKELKIIYINEFLKKFKNKIPLLETISFNLSVLKYYIILFVKYYNLFYSFVY